MGALVLEEADEGSLAGVDRDVLGGPLRVEQLGQVIGIGSGVIERVLAWISPAGYLLRVGIAHRPERELHRLSTARCRSVCHSSG
jgi:hypothetical protein